MEQTMRAMDALPEASDRELNDRYELRNAASPMERLLAEWLAERARFIGSLIGLTDGQFNSETAPGQWTCYRKACPHPGTAFAEDDCRGPGGKSG
jgi:hypothetical protein